MPIKAEKAAQLLQDNILAVTMLTDETAQTAETNEVQDILAVEHGLCVLSLHGCLLAPFNTYSTPIVACIKRSIRCYKKGCIMQFWHCIQAHDCTIIIYKPGRKGCIGRTMYYPSVCIV